MKEEMTPYVNFNGNCLEAMRFYARHLGGDLRMMRYGDAPANACAAQMPAEAADLVMHARIVKGDKVVLMASDCPPGMDMQTGNNFWINVACDSTAEIDKLFAAFSEGGQVRMPLGEQFYAARFGMLTDRFGLNWMFIQGEKTTPLPSQGQAAAHKA